MKYNIRTVNGTLQYWLLVLLCSLLLLWPAIYNGYPFIFYDTPGYFISGIDFFSRIDVPFRPAFYGSLIYAALIFNTLWIVVLFQSFITANLILKLNKMLIPRIKFYQQVFVFGFLACFTSLPWIVSYVMPDIFSGIIWLMVIVFFNSPCKNRSVTGLLLLLPFFLMLHLSHFPSFFLLLIVVFSFRRFGGFISSLFYKKFLVLLLSLIISISLSILYNGKVFNSWKLAPFGSVFILGRLVENGLLKDYLGKECETRNFKLCEFKDQIIAKPEPFMWSRESPNKKLLDKYNWRELQTEYSNVVTEVLKTKFISVIKHLLVNFFQQNTKFDAREITISLNGGVPKTISRISPQIGKSVANTKQMQNKINLDEFFALLIRTVYLAALILPASVIFRRDRFLKSPLWKTVIFSGISFVLISNLVSGGMAVVVDRYGAKIIWILPYITILILMEWVLNLNPKRLKNYPRPL